MQRLALLLAALLFAVAFVVAGCGGEEEAGTAPETVTGTLPEETETTTETAPPAEEGNPEAGKQVFLGPGGCGACHTLADAGTSGTVGPNLDEAKPSFELALDRVTNGKGAMPSFK
ncbi:MAG TPA: hypothetical protein VNJ46_00820, partial [Gaiellaceae bacterium]|nr:hypothetical protein [Gaiellaceae bacterium]